MGWLVVDAMEQQQTIIAQWLQNKCKVTRGQLLSKLGKQIQEVDNLPVEGIIEQLAAGLMAACADDLGLSPMELTGLLRSPRRDALAGLVTVIRNDAQ